MPADSHITVIGFDYGLKRIGVAVGQTVTATAQPLTVLSNHQQLDWQLLNMLITEWQPDAFVVGLPLQADGTDSKVTKAVRSFCIELQKRYHLPVHTTDETLSSVAANAMKSVRFARDAIAAQIILETWLTEFMLSGGEVCA